MTESLNLNDKIGHSPSPVLAAGMDSTTTAKGTIAIAFVNEALQCIRARGLDENLLLQNAGISPELLNAPQARVLPDNYGLLWHGIAQAIDDEFFGLDSHRMAAGSFTLLCHALIHADTLERALRRALRFLRLVIDDLEGELVIAGSEAHIVVHDKPPHGTKGLAPPKRAFAYGTFLMILHGLACWLVGRRIPLLHAAFRCTEPAFSDEWRILFAQELRFDEPESGIVFAAEYLALPNMQNERTMKEFLRRAPANFLVKYRNSTGLAAQIRRQLRELPPGVWPDFKTLAEQFHTSVATLRRRLDEEGSTYRSILDELRKDLAITMLSESRLSLAKIAETLGFAETSAFHRAFKKWTGARPGEYRLGCS